MTHIISVPIIDDYTMKISVNSENVLCFTVSNIQTKYHYLYKNEQSHSLHYDVTVLLSLTNGEIVCISKNYFRTNL